MSATATGINTQAGVQATSVTNLVNITEHNTNFIFLYSWGDDGSNDFGEGLNSHFESGYTPGSTYSVAGSHAYTTPGTYTITVQIQDEYGGSPTIYATATAYVSAAPPSQVSPFCAVTGPLGGTGGPVGGIFRGVNGTGGGGGGLGVSGTGNITPQSTSPAGVAYNNGAVSPRSSSLLPSTGLGTLPLGVDLGWTNLPGYNDGSGMGSGSGSGSGSGGGSGSGSGSGSGGGSSFVASFGENMTSPDLPYLEPGASSGLVAVENAGNGVFFGYNGGTGTYSPQFFSQDSLVSDGSGGFKLTQSDGTTIDYYGFGSGVPAAQQGKLDSYTDAEGHTTTTTYNSSGQMTSIQRTDGTTTVSYAYTYVASGVNAGRVSGVALRSGPAGGTLTSVQQVAFTYYDGTTSYGNAGDLETETLEDASGNSLGTTYYRYYTAADLAAGGVGYVGGLKYQFNPESYARLVAAVGNPTTASDSAVAPYADQYYEYDSNLRVSKTVVQGAGCSCSGSTGQGAFTYAYSTSTNTAGPNSWQTKTVETLPDGSQNIVFTNSFGEVMFKATYDPSDANNSALNGLVWGTDYRYDSAGRLILTAQPSAVTITSLSALNSAAAANADIVGAGYSGGGTYQYLASGTGEIDLTDYGTSTTATSTTPGDVTGYLKDDKVQNGYAGTPILLDSTQYVSHTPTGGATTYPVATSTVYRNSDGTGGETTTNSYTWFSGANQMQSQAVSAPVISSGQNGPGTADVTTTVDDVYGRPIWTKDGDGFIDYTAYDPATGAVVKSIQDVDTTQTSEFTGLPSGWSTPTGGGLNLVTTYQVDSQGRTTEETDPDGNVTYTVYDDVDHEVRVYPGWNATTGTTTGPTQVTREDYAGSYLETLTMAATPAVSGSTGSYVPTGAETISAIQTLSRTYMDNAGRPIEKDDYFSFSGVTYSTAKYLGTAGTNYYVTSYGYDDIGRLAHVVDPNGTITDTYYDALGRPVSVYVGTTSSTTPSEEWASDHVGMTLVTSDQYDGNGVGDSNLTQTTHYPDASSSDNRVTQYAYDWRDRLVATKLGVQSTEDTTTGRPITYSDLDNLGEVTAVSVYDGDGVTLTSTRPSASLLRSYTVTGYDDQGRVYLVQQYDVNPTTGSVSTTALTTGTYYDHRGDRVAVSAPGGLWTKVQYDGAGRVISQAQTDGASGTTWADGSALTGDHVLTQTLTTYDGDGNAILVTTKDRFDNDTSSDTGSLGNPTTGPEARVSYVANYYDAANRLTATANVGTNGGSSYSRPSSAPSRSDTVLVTSDTYNAAGWVQDETDPKGIDTRTSYDALGRPIQVIDDYDYTIGLGLPTNSANQTTAYTYDGLGHTTSVTVVMPSGTPNQTTAFVYGVTTAGGSAVNSNDLLATTENPDPTTGNPSTSASNQTSVQYNAFGQKISATDPNGTTHAYTYDVLGRQVSDAVTTLGSGVDGSVRRLTTAYNSTGQAYLYTSYNAASGGSIVNQVEDVYNGLGQLTGEYQEQGGAVNLSTTPEVQYAYTAMSGGQNNSRLTSMTYPNGRVVDYVYNSGLDAAISRVSALADDSGGTPSTTLQAYSYLGLGTIVAMNDVQAGVELTYIQQSGDSNANTDGGDRYTGLDRFGRVIDQNWINTSTGASVDRLQYAHDRDGNVLSRNDLVETALSQLYSYDNLSRLSSFSQGTLSGGAISSPTSSQAWSLDALGNWSGETTNSTTVTKSFNTQNQATSVSSGTAPTFDASGNTVTDSGDTYVYDAWNRLVAVKNSGGTTVAAYAYDSLGRRVTETYSGSSTTNHLYYSSQWQVIEERQNGTATSNVSQQYVWSLAGIDTLVLLDSYSSGSLSQRLFALQDANLNTTALIGATGTIEERYAYDPYGDVSVLDASGTPRTGNMSSYGWQYLYQGGRLDEVMGWYGFRNRDYIASEGRWAEKDPWGFAAGDTNIYRFVGSQPSDKSDPSGEVVLSPGTIATVFFGPGDPIKCPSNMVLKIPPMRIVVSAPQPPGLIFIVGANQGPLFLGPMSPQNGIPWFGLPPYNGEMGDLPPFGERDPSTVTPGIGIQGPLRK